MTSRRTTRVGVSCFVLAVVSSACGGASSGGVGPASPRLTTRLPNPTSTGTPSAVPDVLSGVVVGIDPGHNGGNFTHTNEIARLIWNGREKETCNTTGTATDNGYTEARFNFRVASRLRHDLQRLGATVVTTRQSNSGVGPCVNRRAQIIDRSGADVAIDIHADGGPPGGRGFAILEPVADGINDAIIGPSRKLGLLVRSAFRRVTGMPTSTYDGSHGIVFRNDLAGLNLTTVPEVLIECGNMRNATDAALLSSPVFQRQAARALADAITAFVARAAHRRATAAAYTWDPLAEGPSGENHHVL